MHVLPAFAVPNVLKSRSGCVASATVMVPAICCTVAFPPARLSVSVGGIVYRNTLVTRTVVAVRYCSVTSKVHVTGDVLAAPTPWLSWTMLAPIPAVNDHVDDAALLLTCSSTRTRSALPG